MSITQGTTPTVTFKFDMNWDYVSNLTATFTQKDSVVVELDYDRFTYEDSTISAVLTQKETLALSQGSSKVQLKVLDIGDSVFASNIITVMVNEILDKGELS